MEQDKRSYDRVLPIAAATLTLFLWTFQCLHWWSILDADSALYSIMSLEVLRGHHYLYTAGQVHGGTPLVYVRAAAFHFFGISQFLGFWINGIALAATAALWCRAALALGGPLAGLVVGLLCSLPSTVLAQFSCTDYYVLGAAAGGAMLCVAIWAAREKTITAQAMFGIGLLAGFSLYICRFTALYVVISGLAYYGLASPENRAALVPTLWELKRTRGVKKWLSIGFSTAAVLHLALVLPAFITDDSFLGVNAEIALKIGFKCLAVLWILHRFALFLSTRFLGLALGLLAGLVPHAIFVWRHSRAIDRTTGLVRWSALSAELPQFAARLGTAFSATHPFSLGLIASACAALCIAMGLVRSPQPHARALRFLTLGLGAMIGSWLLVHTYMYLVPQYLYPAYFPLFLCMGLSVATVRGARLKSLAAVLALPMLVGGGVDFARRMQEPNLRVESGALERFRAWGVHAAGAEYWSSYDMMWAYGGGFVIDPLHASRFPQYQTLLTQEPRIGYLYKEGDSDPPKARLPSSNERAVKTRLQGPASATKFPV